MTTQPLDTAAIQARYEAATPGTWWRDGSEIHAGEPGTPAASTWVAETVNLNLPDHGEANAAAIVTTHNAMPALLARVAELEQQLAAARALLPTDPTEDINASWIRPRFLRAALNGDTTGRPACDAPHPVDDRVRCDRFDGHWGWHAANGNGWPNPVLPRAASAAPGAR